MIRSQYDIWVLERQNTANGTPKQIVPGPRPRLKLGRLTMTTYTVSSGHTSSGITLNSGDALVVLSGGTAIRTTVNSGGNEYVSAGGTASGTVANSGGNEWIFPGGTDISATLNGGRERVDHGTVLGITVNSGGNAGINYNSVASGITVTAVASP